MSSSPLAIAPLWAHELVHEGYYDLHRPCRPAIVVKVTGTRLDQDLHIEPDAIDGRPWREHPKLGVFEFFGPFALPEAAQLWRAKGRKGARPKGAGLP